ncbi:hypothetical protein A5740_02310 [Mycobacterium sp. GA-1841]|uniref:DUF3060 domain-containing protein n=1 Tax=Mycobacterium sp. GA-1841 TaxID=1834154 RepID=UPI00096D1AAA|nr:DUF3060 domain-containing protein [Mycobacterium sp. GA-1841]OMC38906.1 hypothetical protein A5740_02310 [Mycobacterium sp. GA-1841]
MTARFRYSPLILGAGAAIAALTLSACGSESSDTTTPSATAGSSGVNVEIGNTINYMSVGTTTEIDCGDGKSLTVGGTNNTLTVKGTCANVNIGGSDNKITFERIDKALTIVGLNNTINYAAGDPKVNNTGTNNTVDKG